MTDPRHTPRVYSEAQLATTEPMMTDNPRVYRRVEFPLTAGPEVVSLLNMEEVVNKARELGAPDNADVTRPRDDTTYLGGQANVVFAIEWETGE